MSVRPAAVSPAWFSSRGACDLRRRRYRSSPAKGQRRIMRRNNSSDEEPGSPAPPGGQERDGGGRGGTTESIRRAEMFSPCFTKTHKKPLQSFQDVLQFAVEKILHGFFSCRLVKNFFPGANQLKAKIFFSSQFDYLP